jgi:serine/threonine protein kinase
MAVESSQRPRSRRPSTDAVRCSRRDQAATPGHLRRACEIVRDAALALGHAHRQGVIHRDLKPDNLMVDRVGRVHLIDFGVARFFEDASVTMAAAAAIGSAIGRPGSRRGEYAKPTPPRAARPGPLRRLRWLQANIRRRRTQLANSQQPLKNGSGRPSLVDRQSPTSIWSIAGVSLLS